MILLLFLFSFKLSIIGQGKNMITLPSLNDLPSKWNEIRVQLETDLPASLEALLQECLTEHETKQFEQDFIDCIGCAPEEYVRIRRAILLLELVILIVQTN